jgi:hypothetical protein
MNAISSVEPQMFYVQRTAMRDLATHGTDVTQYDDAIHFSTFEEEEMALQQPLEIPVVRGRKPGTRKESFYDDPEWRPPTRIWTKAEFDRYPPDIQCLYQETSPGSGVFISDGIY